MRILLRFIRVGGIVRDCFGWVCWNMSSVLVRHWPVMCPAAWLEARKVIVRAILSGLVVVGSFRIALILALLFNREILFFTFRINPLLISPPVATIARLSSSLPRDRCAVFAARRKCLIARNAPRVSNCCLSQTCRGISQIGCSLLSSVIPELVIRMLTGPKRLVAWDMLDSIDCSSAIAPVTTLRREYLSGIVVGSGVYGWASCAVTSQPWSILVSLPSHKIKC